MGRVSGKQMMAAMEQLNYQNSDFFKDWVKRRYSGTITTTANEEFIGCAKRQPQVQAASSECPAVIILSGVLMMVMFSLILIGLLLLLMMLMLLLVFVLHLLVMCCLCC